MSWDVLLLRLPPEVTTLEDLPDDADDSVGPLAEVVERIRAGVPGIDLTDPSWGILEGSTFSIEFAIGKDDPCRSLMLHVRGDDRALEPIRRLCAATGWRAFDCATAEVVDFEAGEGTGLDSWRAYRELVVPNAPKKGVVVTRKDGSRIVVDAVGTPGSAFAPRKRWWEFWKSGE